MTSAASSREILTEKMEDRFATARGVADTLLYEGYVLYPYHATHGKNRGGVRFQWGVLVPPAWHEVDPTERSGMRTELIVDPGSEPAIAIRLRFLRLQHRGVEVANAGADGGFTPTARLEVGDRVWMEWDEAIEQDLDLGVIALLPLPEAVREIPFQLTASAHTEVVTGGAATEGPLTGDALAGRIVRTTEPISGVARVMAQWADGPEVLLKVTIELENTTPWLQAGAGREDVMRRSLIAVHTLAAVEDAAFCSLFDPPAGAAEAVAGCRSIGSYAVLVGQPGATDLVLASPIILYDYPAIAPESEGDFHDGCEIDEILALRVLTLTDDEKADARGTDPRSRAIVDRCDNMATDSWDKLHGTMREIRTLDPGSGGGPIDHNDAVPAPWLDPVADAQFDPWTNTIFVDGIEIGKGARVRLHPNHRADVHDMFLAGLTATVAGVFHDVDGGFHIAVTVDGDPATELYEMQGRFYYFHPDEIEPLTTAEADASGQAEAMAQAGRAADAGGEAVP